MRVLVAVLLVLLTSALVWAQGNPIVDPWQDGNGYPGNTLVRYDQTVYLCQRPGTPPSGGCNIHESPQSNPERWNALSGLRQYTEAATYIPGLAGTTVMRNGSTYTAVAPNGVGTAAGTQDPGVLPQPNPYWRIRDIITFPAVIPADFTSTEIQVAINAAPAGGIVQLGCGTYTQDSPATITIPKRLTIQGCGEGTRINGFAGATVFTLTATETVAFDAAIVIRDMTIVVAANGIGILANPTAATRGNTFDNLTILNGAVGIDIRSNTALSIINNARFAGQTTYSVKMTNATQGCEPDAGGIFDSILFPTANGTSGGVYVTSGGFRFIGNKILADSSQPTPVKYGIRAETACAGEFLVSASQIDGPDEPISIGNRAASVWSSVVTYQIDAVVTFGGRRYVARAANLNKQPNLFPAIWSFEGNGTIIITGSFLRGIGNTIAMIGTSPAADRIFNNIVITGNRLGSIGSLAGNVINLEQVGGVAITGNDVQVDVAYRALRLKDVFGITWSGNSLTTFDAVTNPFNLVSGVVNTQIENSRSDMGNAFSFTLAILNGMAVTGLEGSVMQCSDCMNPGDGGWAGPAVCAAGGSGNNARRLNNKWICS